MDNVLYEDLDFPERYQSFVVFDPASIRIQDSDILFIGNDVKKVFDSFMNTLVSKEQTMKEKIFHNRLQKVSSMLSLLQSFDNVLITRFFDRIWRRYSYVSQLGESFIDLATYVDYFPESKKNISSLMATRQDRSDDFDEDSDDDTNSDDDDNQK